MITQLLSMFFFTTVYAFIRYAGFGHVPLIHLPVYITNKAICMTAVESLLLAAVALKRSDRKAVRFWGSACTQLIFVHILLSLGILSKGYYINFFDGDKMSLTGELVLLMGALAVYCFWRLQASAIKPAVRRTLTILASALVSGHLFAMGFKDTLHVEKWNGGLPPMSMISFLLAISSVVVMLLTREQHSMISHEEDRALPSPDES
jgi:hypothetical protein